MSHRIRSAIVFLLSLPTVLFVLSSTIAAYADQKWPRLAPQSTGAICRDAFLIAETMFKSNNFYLFAPPPEPVGLQSTFIMKPTRLFPDLFKDWEHDMMVDTHVLKPIPDKVLINVVNHLFWQKSAEEGFRYVVHRERSEWGGNYYSIFAVPEALSSGEFLGLRYSGQGSEPDENYFLFGMLRPPLMLETKDTRRVWGIFANDAVPFQEWIVFSLSRSGSVENCKIAFGPAVKKSFAEVLPEDVSKLAGSLDRLLRKGESGGGLTSADELPADVLWAWANVAMRPWAVQPTLRKDSKDRVDWGFLAWLKTRKAYAVIYDEIIDQHPKAEKALASYYAHQLGKSPEESENLAQSALAFLYRTYFVYAHQ